MTSSNPTHVHFHAGYNMPGYLPESDDSAYPFATFEDARASLVDDMRRHADSEESWSEEHDCNDIPCPTFGDSCPWQKAGTIRLEAEELESAEGPEFLTYAGDLAYWITPCQEDDCGPEDDDCAYPDDQHGEHDHDVCTDALRSYGERMAEEFEAGQRARRAAAVIDCPCGRPECFEDHDPPRRGSGPGAMLATKRTWNGSRRSLEDVTPEELAGYRDGQKVAHNTYVEHDADGSVGVRFHSTRVITFHADGSFTVNTSGYRTTTTKQRINALLPAGYRVYQVSYVWRIATPEGDFEFEDGDTWKG